MKSICLQKGAMLLAVHVVHVVHSNSFSNPCLFAALRDPLPRPHYPLTLMLKFLISCLPPVSSSPVLVYYSTIPQPLHTLFPLIVLEQFRRSLSAENRQERNRTVLLEIGLRSWVQNASLSPCSLGRPL